MELTKIAFSDHCPTLDEMRRIKELAIPQLFVLISDASQELRIRQRVEDMTIALETKLEVNVLVIQTGKEWDFERAKILANKRLTNRGMIPIDEAVSIKDPTIKTQQLWTLVFQALEQFNTIIIFDRQPINIMLDKPETIDFYVDSRSINVTECCDWLRQQTDKLGSLPSETDQLNWPGVFVNIYLTEVIRQNTALANPLNLAVQNLLTYDRTRGQYREQSNFGHRPSQRHKTNSSTDS